MAIRTERFVEEPGLVLYAHPEPNLATWNIAGPTILCIEGTGANTGIYTVTYDDTISSYWGIFIGATQPVNWNLRIAKIIPDTSGSNSITVDPQAFSNIETGLINGNELIIYENETRIVLFTLTSGTFGNVPLKFVLEDENGTAITTITGLTSNTNALVVTIPPIPPGTCCGASWAIRVVSGNTVVISGPVIVNLAPG